ncbi:MAG: CinA family protein [Eubacterium coprostanoligenes]|uniref:CinA family protein n=1 Tax=Eubacterium coprostanoligenes TaxID=290054 RepID=UPI0023F55F62|nr:CinA family protein [Eubacterium coprostanoligenes]MDD7357564.1 CinA family protein [Eubacterium coprostanoligenes]
MTIEEQVVNKLIDRGFHISFAESCTGGLCCGTLVNVSNASKVLDMSFVTYANEAKVELINVSHETIENYGVVSEQVAGEMCIGVAEKAHSEVGVGVTGVAGPTGGTAKKPVGMVCFGFYVLGNVTARTMQFGNIGRNEVRAKSVDFVFNTLAELLEKQF